MTTTLELSAGPARVVLAPDVGGAIAAYEWHGKPVLRPTPQDALTQVQTIAHEWIETAQELGRAVPEPKGRLLFA